uniref:Uncharacterized protein n=1 Tax=Arundo donax TaxID=35708 RepID=A0A0A9HMQ1_ARUDO
MRLELHCVRCYTSFLDFWSCSVNLLLEGFSFGLLRENLGLSRDLPPLYQVPG